ncbi:MAG: hypothetical protein ACXABK_03865 [Candidatus Heimdallarchaeaceae archaeon]|jgi:hypothetical protein
MSDYIIRHYQEGYEVEQAKLGSKVVKDWINAHQTSADRLKEVYSQPNFDPETRHYCFKDDKMVGFLTSRIIEDDEADVKKASFVFPSVLPGNEDAVDLLYKTAIKTLQDKGAKKVETYASALCGNQVELANKYGFNFVKDVENIVYSLQISNIDDSVDTSGIRKFEFEKDGEKWLEIFKQLDNLDEERLKQYKDTLTEEEENVVAHLVIEEEGEIVGTTLLYRNPIKKNAANLAMTYVTDPSYLFQLAAKAAKIAKKSGIDYFLIWLFENRLSLKKTIEQLNVNYAQPSASLFEKNI